ncbi:hypothetical protein QTP70_008365 [Hemibagrus guttatus]|uniref:Alkylated DNA repair protein AlkB homologue 8 N-terminal domain-containing protein n=1 Tax=Hemibagrus guttatus TaxID=175788 RepID=A0AAE0PWZ9_9TELE|nr:hypothetical protein QTP70_008365 [Hemibagrus guttatus]KAK3527831.1 hypothetical protein QTP86_006901 [Hemibagrus guttatus]
MHSSNHIIKFTDDTTVVGLISKNDESAYREEMPRLTAWCKANNLSLNMEKTKRWLLSSGEWSLSALLKPSTGPTWRSSRAPNSLVFTWRRTSPGRSTPAPSPRKPRKAHLPPPILTTFYRGTIESILSSCITA